MCVYFWKRKYFFCVCVCFWKRKYFFLEGKVFCVCVYTFGRESIFCVYFWKQKYFFLCVYTFEDHEQLSSFIHMCHIIIHICHIIIHICHIICDHEQLSPKICTHTKKGLHEKKISIHETKTSCILLKTMSHFDVRSIVCVCVCVCVSACVCVCVCVCVCMCCVYIYLGHPNGCSSLS